MAQPIDSRFPCAVQELWAELSTEVTWLHGRWIIYRQLFGTNKERVDLLNESAGMVSWILQDLLLKDVQLSISRLADRAGKGNRRNLSLRRLQADLCAVGEVALANSLESLLTRFEVSCSQILDRRNKWIAHSDLETMLAARAVPLSGPSRAEIEAALAALRQALDCVGIHYTGSTIAYEHFVMRSDGADLLMEIGRAKRYRLLVADGTIPRDDLRRHFPKGV
jgi:AbiU2